jgi:hypothetical protein
MGYANLPFRCGSSAADVDAEAEKGFMMALKSTFFLSDNMTFMSEISLICKGRGCRVSC